MESKISIHCLQKIEQNLDTIAEDLWKHDAAHLDFWTECNKGFHVCRLR